ncbi:hypothetical protein [Dermacoccus nishinomiyaensis]|uniref:hypothetical protein n=1 Tax=Dermacoccus nishinomiyaensis TaxID=1274 RepID=UPI0013F44CE8|nr:hypothetical protein [Dermacoccus nishinomiyaensis]NHC31932.1 hypothetical protein [Dermacoccus nishinomiyaensis]
MSGVTFGRKQVLTPGSPVIADGIGKVKPSTFAITSHHTMYVTDVVWSSWGGQVARATGIAENGENSDSMVDLPRQKAYITAKLGTCRGRPAYTKVAWNFTSFEKNETNLQGWYNICDLASN